MSPTLGVVNGPWYDGHVSKSLLTNTESPTLLVVDQPWYDGHVPESLRNEHGKDWSSTWHVVHNMTVYATNTERISPARGM